MTSGRPILSSAAYHLLERYTRTAINGQFGTGRHLHQGEDSSNQYRNGKQFINMPGYGQRHEQQHIAQFIVAAPHRIQFVDQVEQREQHDERSKHQRDADINFPPQITGEQLHRFNLRQAEADER